VIGHLALGFDMGQKRGSVLCVDDEPGILRSLQWLLRKDFDVMTAPSGHQGLALVLENNFDVVISDQRMPGMMGSEFLREVRKASPRALRILLTGYSDMQGILRSVNEGEVFRFINKPWNIGDLPRIVGDAVAIAQGQVERDVTPEDLEDTALQSNSDKILLVDDDPAIADLLSEVVGSGTRVVHATNLADAIEFLDRDNISVIVADTRVDGTDTTRLIKMLKQKHPELVTVVFSEMNDATEVITLINQVQIYRYVPKPAKVAYLKIVIQSAQRKHTQLLADPEIMKRHLVEGVTADVEKSLMVDIEHAARRKSELAPQAHGTGSLLHKITGGFMRLFSA
jgi:DNA-binding NtrC family response regulator